MRSHRQTGFRISVAVPLLVSAICFASYAAVAASPSATLTGAQEVPAVSSAASGVCTIAVAPDMTVSGGVDTTGIEGTMAHIHLGAVGVNGPVVVTLEKVSATRWSVPAGTKLTAAQYQSYKAGELYVNVHSEAHKGGEIRLQLTP